MTKVDYTFERRMKLNYEEGEKDGILKGEARIIREIMKNENKSAEEVMKSVGIPESEYDIYLKML